MNAKSHATSVVAGSFALAASLLHPSAEASGVSASVERAGVSSAVGETMASFPSLREVVRLARAQAPDAVRARGAVAVTEASYAGAKLAPLDNPYLETFVDRGAQGVTRDVTVQSNLWLPLEVSGQRSARIAEVDAAVDWHRTLAASTELVVAGDAVRAYGGALVAAARVRTLESIVLGARAEVELYDQRQRAGDATMQESTLASLELARNEVLLEEGRADLSRALGELARTTGRTFASPTGPPCSAPRGPIESRPCPSSSGPRMARRRASRPASSKASLSSAKVSSR